MNFDSSILHINTNTLFELNGEKINLSDMVNQYQMAKKYCGDDWENCKPRLEEKPYDQQFEKEKDQDLINTEIKPKNKKSLTSREEVKNILDGFGEDKAGNTNLKKGNDFDRDSEKDVKVSIPKYAMSSSSSANLGGKNGDYYGRVDPVNNEIVLNV